jgi:hypothetical protein
MDELLFKPVGRPADGDAVALTLLAGVEREGGERFIRAPI